MRCQKSERRPLLLTFLLGLCAFGAPFATATAHAADPPAAPASPPASATADIKVDESTPPTTIARALQASFMNVSRLAGPATVRILSFASRAHLADFEEDNGTGFDNGDPSRSHDDFSRRSDRALGSGVIIRPEGYILTNDHVVEDSPGGKVLVTLADDRTFVGAVTRDILSDLAIVKIDAGAPLPYVRIGDSSKLQVGEWAIVIGAPFDQPNTMTSGIVSALHRNREIPDGDTVGIRYYSDLIQTDASINPGNSGGPLLNIDGELIGVNVAIVSPSGVSSGVGFAIPANSAIGIANQLIAKGRATHANLGIVPADIPYFLRTRLGTEHGAYVTQVPYDTAADRAGLEPGDVIVRFDKTDVSDENMLRAAIGQAEPNIAVPITIVRAGKTQTLSATLTERPAFDDFEARGMGQSQPTAVPSTHHLTATDLGVSVRPLSAQTIKDLRFKADTTGVFVSRVMGGSPASDAGMERGCVISAVNGSAVTTVDNLNADLSSFKSGDIVTFNVYLAPGRNVSAARGVVDIQVP